MSGGKKDRATARTPRNQRPGAFPTRLVHTATLLSADKAPQRPAVPVGRVNAPQPEVRRVKTDPRVGHDFSPEHVEA
ncbi:hypothetical protein Q5P01_022279 [Channa striata]|uniref:Uncharacterized protein n=1 Tax=Channa striata TaxID=64152 RepID=A0AA88IWY3_CHASR|nr:hypothetical protein Q5P01_022279 [Channa striata]